MEHARTVILVTPVGGGWSVRSPQSGETLMFLSGGRAEAQARTLAKCLAHLGFDACIEVHDRRDTIAGRIHYFAEGWSADEGAAAVNSAFAG